MVAVSLEVSPAQDSLVSSYRPIYFAIRASVFVPSDQPMFADLYFFDAGSSSYIYYKTFASTTIKINGIGQSIFEFDLQDGFQEYLQTVTPNPPTTTISILYQYFFGNKFSCVQAKVLFRGSTISSGLLVPNPTIPIQATSTTPAVNGTGDITSNTFYCINSTNPPNYYLDSLSLNNPEAILKANLVPNPSLLSDQRVYPLTNLKIQPYLGLAPINYNYAIETYLSDHGSLPVLMLLFGTFGGLSRTQRNVSLWIDYWSPNSVSVITANVIPSTLCYVGNYNIPVGLQELSLLVPSIVNALINPNNNYYYRFHLIDDSAGRIMFHTPIYKPLNKGIGNMRLFFQNYWGYFEQLSFARSSKKTTITSSTFFKPYLSNIALFNTDNIQLSGKQRYNSRVSDELTLEGLFPEELMEWINELLTSGMVFLDSPQLSATPTRAIQLPGFRIKDDTFTIKEVPTKAGTKYRITVKIPNNIELVTIRN